MSEKIILYRRRKGMKVKIRHNTIDRSRAERTQPGTEEVAYF
jgi:hypothetical protein